MAEGSFFRGSSTDPFINLALEECLLERSSGPGPVLFVWQGRNAVVIGRHQNPWLETNGDFMKRKRIILARRISGGGAVYIDCGNLNFSFTAPRNLFDPDRQISAVLKGLRKFGIDAAVGAGRSLRLGGYKFSGSAFAYRRDRALHHGTLLVASDLEMMRALAGTLRITGGRGTRSIPSEVVNLATAAPAMTVEALADSIKSGFAEEYGVNFAEKDEDELRVTGGFAAVLERQRSWEWRYGATPPFDMEIEGEGGRVAVNIRGGRLGKITIMPEGELLFDAGGSVRFHRGEVAALVEKAGGTLAPFPEGVVF